MTAPPENSGVPMDVARSGPTASALPAGFVSPRRQRPTKEENDDPNKYDAILSQQLWLARLLQEEALRDATDSESEASTESPADEQGEKVRQLMDNLGTLWSSVSAHARTRLTAGFSLAKIIPGNIKLPQTLSLLAQASERRQSPSAPRNASPLTQRHLAAADLIDQLLVAAAASKPSTDPAALMEPLAEPPAGRELSAVQIQQLWLAKQLREDALSVTSASTARTRSSRLYAATGEIFGKAAPTRAGFYGLALLSKLLSYSTRLPFWMARPSPSPTPGFTITVETENAVNAPPKAKRTRSFSSIARALSPTFRERSGSLTDRSVSFHERRQTHPLVQPPTPRRTVSSLPRLGRASAAAARAAASSPATNPPIAPPTEAGLRLHNEHMSSLEASPNIQPATTEAPPPPTNANSTTSVPLPWRMAHLLGEPTLAQPPPVLPLQTQPRPQSAPPYPDAATTPTPLPLHEANEQLAAVDEVSSEASRPSSSSRSRASEAKAGAQAATSASPPPPPPRRPRTKENAAAPSSPPQAETSKLQSSPHTANANRHQQRQPATTSDHEQRLSAAQKRIALLEKELHRRSSIKALPTPLPTASQLSPPQPPQQPPLSEAVVPAQPALQLPPATATAPSIVAAPAPAAAALTPDIHLHITNTTTAPSAACPAPATPSTAPAVSPSISSVAPSERSTIPPLHDGNLASAAIAHERASNIASELMLTRSTVQSLETQLSTERRIAAEREAAKAAEVARLAQRNLELEMEVAQRAERSNQAAAAQLAAEQKAAEKAAAERVAMVAAARAAALQAEAEALLPPSALEKVRPGGRSEAEATAAALVEAEKAAKAAEAEAHARAKAAATEAVALAEARAEAAAAASAAAHAAREAEGDVYDEVSSRRSSSDGGHGDMEGDDGSTIPAAEYLALQEAYEGLLRRYLSERGSAAARGDSSESSPSTSRPVGHGQSVSSSLDSRMTNPPPSSSSSSPEPPRQPETLPEMFSSWAEQWWPTQQQQAEPDAPSMSDFREWLQSRFDMGEGEISCVAWRPKGASATRHPDFSFSSDDYGRDYDEFVASSKSYDEFVAATTQGCAPNCHGPRNHCVEPPSPPMVPERRAEPAAATRWQLD